MTKNAGERAKRPLRAGILLLLLVAGWSSSAGCAANGTATSMNRERAIQTAIAKAQELGYSTENNDVQAVRKGGVWEVSFVPTGPDTLGGGLVVLIDTKTGEVVEAKFQQ